MIRGGVEYNLGIFVTGVDKDSVADRAGLMVSDKLPAQKRRLIRFTHTHIHIDSQHTKEYSSPRCRAADVCVPICIMEQWGVSK